MSDTLAAYTINKLLAAEQEIEAAHRVLDRKQAPRCTEDQPALSLAARILMLIGEHPGQVAGNGASPGDDAEIEGLPEWPEP
jgi:hypothetical protein